MSEPIRSMVRLEEVGIREYRRVTGEILKTELWQIESIYDYMEDYASSISNMVVDGEFSVRLLGKLTKGIHPNQFLVSIEKSRTAQYSILISQDTFFESAYALGLQPECVMNGSYVWLENLTGAISLYREGSVEHLKILEDAKRIAERILVKSNFIPGQVYENIKGDTKFIYLGKVNPVKYHYKDNRPPGERIYDNNLVEGSYTYRKELPKRPVGLWLELTDKRVDSEFKYNVKPTPLYLTHSSKYTSTAPVDYVLPSSAIDFYKLYAEKLNRSLKNVPAESLAGIGIKLLIKGVEDTITELSQTIDN